jgi:uncharacterized protein (DUF488 family)
MGRIVVHTIGHSTRTLDHLVELLQAHGVTLLTDVRSRPGSRRMPHFDREALERELPARAIGYRHLKDLGGLRKAREDSPNLAWRNESFRGYADYMQTDVWRRALGELIELAIAERVAIMCAEADPRRCHRSLIADALALRGLEVLHITGPDEAAPHSITSFARVEGDRITYPALDTLPLDG